MKYDVWLRSVPGPYAQYDGKVTVQADSAEEAEIKAYCKLRRTAFPERGPSWWRVERIECVE